MRILYNIIISITFILLAMLPVLAGESTVIKNVVVDEAGRIIVIETADKKPLPKPSVARLAEPNRLIIDLPNSSLLMKSKVFLINNNDINKVKVSQYDKTVRLVVETPQNKIIEKIKVSPSENSSIIQLKAIPNSSLYSPTDYSDQARITKVDYRDNQLIIGAIGQIKPKEPFVLKDPTRLIIDIPNAKIDDKKLLSPIVVGDNQVDTVRVGQFDYNTVRIVIETDIPNRFNAVSGNNQQTLFITANPVFSTNTLPKNYSTGFIKNINVIKDNNIGTLVRIETSNPISYRIKRIHNPEKAVIDIINAGPPSEDITSGLSSTSELLNVRIGQLMAGSSNSRVVLDLANPSIEIGSNVSGDGKNLEITLKEASMPIAIAKQKNDIKVVVDAGHGGYDNGCMAEGFKEKDINIDVAKRVKSLLEKYGVNVYMTRSGDDTLSLKERTDFTNSINPDAFVSIHVNASTSASPDGIDTYWYTNQSIPLARKIQTAIINKVEAADRGIKKEMFYVIHHTFVPAVLVEIGFLSNPTERRLLLSPQRKQSTAQGIVEGVLQFLGTKSSVNSSGAQR